MRPALIVWACFAIVNACVLGLAEQGEDLGPVTIGDVARLLGLVVLGPLLWAWVVVAVVRLRRGRE